MTCKDFAVDCFYFPASHPFHLLTAMAVHPLEPLPPELGFAPTVPDLISDDSDMIASACRPILERIRFQSQIRKLESRLKHLKMQIPSDNANGVTVGDVTVGTTVNVVTTHIVTQFKVNKLKKAVLEILGSDSHIEKIIMSDDSIGIQEAYPAPHQREEGIQCNMPVVRTDAVAINVARIIPAQWAHPQWAENDYDIGATLHQRLDQTIKPSQVINRFEVDGECITDIVTGHQEMLLQKPDWLKNLHERPPRPPEGTIAAFARARAPGPCIRGGCQGCMNSTDEGSEWSSTDDQIGREAEKQNRAAKIQAQPKKGATPRSSIKRIRTMNVQGTKAPRLAAAAIECTAPRPLHSMEPFWKYQGAPDPPMCFDHQVTHVQEER